MDGHLLCECFTQQKFVNLGYMIIAINSSKPAASSVYGRAAVTVNYKCTCSCYCIAIGAFCSSDWS